MTKNEALKAAIDGKKITNEFWNGSYFVWDKEKMEFVGTQSSGEINPDWHIKSIAIVTGSGWQILPEYVDFATAWKAYEDGKQIQGENKTQTFQKDVAPLLVFASEIRGKWLILDA